MRNKGFTLLELGVVLIIIALLVGGILGGQTLIRQATISSIVGDFQQHSAAAHTFKEKYIYYPGDLYDSVTRFGSPDNGNGNGKIEANAAREDLVAWYDLGQSGLLSVTMAGELVSSTVKVKVTNPESGIKAVGFELLYDTLTIVGTGSSSINSGNFLRLGKVNSDSDNLSDAGMTPAIAKAVDRKLDDGEAMTGTVVAIAGDDVDATDCVFITYALTNDADACTLVYWLDKTIQ